MAEDQPLTFAPAALYKECVSKAANDGRSLMKHLVDQARTVLQQRSSNELDSAERQLLQEAARHLNMHEHMLCERMPVALMGAFSEAIAADSKARKLAPGSTASALRFDELELMDESQVQESIELARAQQLAMAVADLQLAELNGLICAVLGLKTVQPDRNPLRPEIYVGAIRTTLKLSNTDNAVRVRWMQAMAGILGERLKPIYADICTMLREHGVKPVGYVVTQTPTAGTPSASAFGALRTATGGQVGGGGSGGGGGYASGGAGSGQAGGGQPGVGGQSGQGGQRVIVIGGKGAGGGGAGSAGSAGSAGVGAYVAGSPAGPQYGQQALLTVDQLRRLLSGELDSGRQSLNSGAGGLGPSSGRGGLPSTGRGGLGPNSGAGGLGNFGASTGVGEFGAIPFEEEPQPDFDHTVPAAFDALEEMRQTDRVLKRLSGRRAGAAGGPSSVLPNSQNGTLDDLRRDAKGVGQALGLEVVNLMFENIAQDPHLLPPIQAVIRRIEPAYLRLALIDPRFFSDKEHIARRLLDQLAERSLAYATVLTPGFDAYLKSLKEAAEVLAISQIRDTDPFEYMLTTLEAAWKRQEARESRQRDKAVHALLHAEQRNLLAERMATDIRGKPGAGMAPAEVLSFLCGPWSQVLAEARLTDRKGSPDPHGYMQVAHDLIWTTQPEQSRSNMERINALIPALLERLREGLESVAYPQSHMDAFGVVLLAIYDNILQGQSTDSRLDRNSVFPRQSRGMPLGGESDTNDPWLAPSEAQESGFLDISEARSTLGEDFKHTETLFESTSPQILDDPQVKASERSKPPIPPGAWVELGLHDQTLRAQLTWSSPYGTLFMFTDSSGTTHSLTRRALDKLLARGSVTVISQGVVNEALDAVAQKAMRNSLDIDL